MTGPNDDLQARLTALGADFAALGGRAAGAARALTSTVPPATDLLDDLGAARHAFSILRADVLEKAGALAVVLEADRLRGLRDLEPALAAIAAAEAQRARLAAWEEARREALGVLAGALALVHREDKSLPVLDEAHRQARELHATLSGPPPEALEDETSRLPARTRPYADLLALAEGWNVLDDERCAALQDAIIESFGRALSLAALRGKLGRAGEAAPAVARPRVRAPVPPVEAPPRMVEIPVEPPVAPPAPVAPRAAPAAPAASPNAPAPPAPVTGVVSPRESAGIPSVAVSHAEVGVAKPALKLERIPSAPEHEAELERLAREMAPWWTVARDSWRDLAESGRSFGDAARAYLERFPYLLSVPLQRSTDYEGGQLAEGYALLLAHVEKQEPGFVEGALSRLSPQFAAHDPGSVYPVGPELYLYVVAEGRLYKAYPDFVREMVLHAVPRLDVWVQGGIVEDDEETRLFMRAETVGSSEEQTRVLTERKERLGPHLFRVTLGPLTTRFFTLQLAGETLADPPNVEIKLTENDAPTDHAWLITLPALGQGKPAAPRKQRPGGTTLEELGPQFGGFWMAVFNADPHNDRVCELSVILRRKPPPITDAPPAPAQNFFAKKK